MDLQNIEASLEKLSVGDGIAAENAAWSFGGDIPKNFEDHVAKSVPFYAEGLQHKKART